MGSVELPHAILVFLNEFLLVFFIFHPIFTRDDKVGCDSTLWTRPAKKSHDETLLMPTDTHAQQQQQQQQVSEQWTVNSAAGWTPESSDLL